MGIYYDDLNVVDAEMKMQRFSNAFFLLIVNMATTFVSK